VTPLDDEDPRLLALLREAKERPEDEGVRFVLADWLEDHDQAARAEFVRLRCRLAVGASLPPAPEERKALQERAEKLFAHFGGAWLGPLWRWGGLATDWHRGLLCARLERRCLGEPLESALPWMSAALFEAPGCEALHRVSALLNLGTFNHVSLALRRPFRETLLLEWLARVRESTCLRSLTFWWPVRMGRRAPGQANGPWLLGLSEDFFAHLLEKLPIGRHLTHLGSNLPFAPEQSGRIEAADIRPVLAQHWRWHQDLSPSAFSGKWGCVARLVA
jgi:uncharacterized protein (TIGR02996 family)